MCTAFRGSADAYPNLTIKKIPKTVLSRCEWGRDDYSLEIANLPSREPDNGNGDGNGHAPKDRKRARGKAENSEPNLFSEREV
jgi:adenine-specific DNA-methyltransferase